MIEHIERRALALLLVVLMVFAMVPVHAFAAGTRTETASMGNLGISVSIPTENGGSPDLGSFSLTGNTIVATAKAEANTNSCTGITSYNATQTIITFTNNASGEAMIRFDFNINGGKLEVNGVEQATSGSYATGAIAAGGTLEVKLYSPESGANKVGDSGSLKLTNLEIIENNTVNVVFKPGTNGTVKVKGAAISADTTVTTTYVEGVAVAATPASGYKFIAWVDETNTVVSAAANTTLHLSQNATVRAYFVPTSTNGYWLAGSKIHTDLENAIAAAQAADGMVRLLDSTTLTKSVTIPAGVTVVIPCDTDMIFYGENPVALKRPEGTLAAPTAFRTLTMADGVVLTVYGSLEASARHYVAHGGKFDGGRVIDKYGFIKMNTNSRIDVQSGGKLFAWGYISGSGKVNAYSGATVYEKFQIADYRGGGITSIIVPSGVFPFNQYYVQNVEVPETIHAGATLMCNAGIYGAEVVVSNLEFIGANGMFNVGAGSTATKRYDAATDRLVIDVDGSVGLNSISLMDYNTANFVLPINNNITVNVNSGMTTVNQDIMLLPGAEVNVDRDAYMVLASGKKVYLMDADNWGNYCFGATMRPIYYTVANGTTVKRSTLSDAKVNLNGTAVVQGQLYASTSGAQIVSTGKTGVVILMNNAPSGTTNIKQSPIVKATDVMNAITKISVGAALLTNADTTTVNTNGAAQHTTYVYDSVLDKWVTTAVSIAPTLTYNANGGNGADRPLTINYQNTALSRQPLSQVVDGAGTFTREGAVFTGWNTAADGSGKAFAPGDFITISQNTTLFAQWRNTSATVSFAANAPEGTTAQGQMNSQTLILDENGNSEFEVPACGYTVDGYTFDGWLGSDGNYYVIGQVYTVSGDLTLTAQWTKSSAVITFNANAPAGTTASGAMSEQFAPEGAKLNPNAFSVTGYTFVGWNTKADGSGTAYADAATAPTENTTLYAQWKINTYTITWIIDGKSETTTVNHGQVPVAPVATKAPVGCTVYTFDSWDKTIVAATTDATYTAVFTESASHTEGTPVTENKVEADCNNDGSYDTVVYCSVCGAELSRKTTTIPALGHSEPVYSNNGDTHSAVYPCCGEAYVTNEPHDFENEDHKCVCGMVEIVHYTVEVYYMDTEGNYPETPSKTMNFSAPYGTEVDHYDDVQTPGFVISGKLPQAIVTESFVMKVQMCRAAIQIQYRDEQDNILDRQLIYFEATDTLRTDEEVAPARTGYTFVGWATEIGGDVVYGLDNLEYTNTSTYFVDVEVLYPVYELSTYTVTFTVLGQVYDTVTVTYGEEIALPETDPEVEGYRFNGWKNVPDTMPDNDLTIEADLVEQVTISYYHYNIDTYQYEYDYDVTVDKGAEVELPYYYWNYSNTLGWDANDDGVVDYEYNETITADESLTLKPVLVPFYADVYLGAEDAVFVDAEGNPITRIYAENAYINEIILTNHPTRVGYTFLGWLVDGSENLVYTNEETGKLEVRLFFGDNCSATALWKQDVYTITFEDGKGNVLLSDGYTYGQMPSVPANPTRADEDGYKFIFAGWSPTVVEATEDAVYVATWTKTRITYTVNFDTNGDGIIDVSKTVAHGDAPVAPAFSLADTAEWDYTLIGWRDSNGNIYTTLPAATVAETYTAVYTAVKQTYEITWIIDGVSETTTVEYGAMPTHADPSKADTDEYTYTFAGWSPKVVAVTGEATYTAAFTAQKRSYTITWIIDGASETTTVEYGAMPTHADPSKADTAEYTYTFAGWSPEVKAVTGDATYTAAFTAQKRSYTITWIIDGASETTTVEYGVVPTHADPSKAETAQYTYTFAGWSPEVVAVTGEATYTANFTPVLRSYDITFVVDGVEKVVSTKYGETPVYDADGKLPEKAADAYYSYTFAGWTPALEAVTGEATYTATWTETPVEYTITFMEGNEIIGMITGNYGDAVDMTKVPATDRLGYTFNGWNTMIPDTIPAEDLVINGSWTVNTYSIYFTAIDRQQALTDYWGYTLSKKYGEPITEADLQEVRVMMPEIYGYQFDKWMSEIPATMPAEYLNIYGRWAANEHMVYLYDDFDLTNMMVQIIFRYDEHYNSIEDFIKINSLEACLAREGYTLAGFKYEDGTDLTFPYVHPDRDVNLIVQYVPNEYTINFMDGSELITSVTAGYQTAITLPENPTKEGYVFACWVDADGNAVDLSTMPMNGMTVYASWTVDSFMLNFFASEGDTTAYQTVEVTYGTELNDACLELMLSLIPDPVKEGYTWNGWNIDNVPETMPASAVNVYGEWTANTYTIYWNVVENVNGETMGEFSVDFQFGSAITAPEYTAPAGYEVVDVQSYPATMPAEALYLQITIAPKTYTVTFDSCGGTPVDSISAAYLSAITAPAAPTKTGHIFMGWSVDGETVIDFPATMPIDGLNLKAVWQKDTVYITFIIEGVETVKAFAYGDAIVAPEATKAADAKWTYKFVGWDAELPAYATETAAYTALFAEDEAVKYNVKFVDGENVVFETQIAWNDVVTLDGFTAPELTGNTLAWTVDGAAASFPYAMTTTDVTFVASWTPITYTVYYYTVDGFENGEPAYTAQATYGAAFPTYTLTLPEGYDFGYWADANGNAYDLPETMPAQDLHLIAQLTPKTFTVTWFYGVGLSKQETYTYGATVNGFIPERVYLNTETHRGWVDHVGWYNLDTNEHIDIPFTMPAENLSIYSETKFTGWMGGPNQSFFIYVADYLTQQGWFCVNDKNELVTDGSGEWYYAGDDENVVSDITEIEGVLYAFDHVTGAFLADYTGIYEALNGDLYYVENGVAVKHKGLVKDVLADGHIHYYYFGCVDNLCNDAGCAGEYKAQKNIYHWTEITNGYLVQWGYQFDENGVIVHDEDTSKNGVHLDNGVKFYYIDGVKVHIGLFIGDDGEFYYAKSDGALIVDREYWISESHVNGLTHNGEPIVEGSYTFDAEGRIVWPDTEKNGVYLEDGKLFYYVSGSKSYAGLIRYTGNLYNASGAVIGTYDNDYIYVRTSGELAVGKYWTTKNNDLLTTDLYQFDKSGKMLMLSGIIAEDGSLYYYEDGLRNYAGLIEINGSYYYVRTNGEVVNGRTYWITKTNGLMNEGSFEFAADGKMIIPEPVAVKNGIYRENGKLFYYVDGKPSYAGLIQYTGGIIEEDGTVTEGVYQNAYIYVRTSGELAVGSYWTTKHNDVMKAALYQFDESGVMINPAV